MKEQYPGQLESDEEFKLLNNSYEEIEPKHLWDESHETHMLRELIFGE